MAQYELMRNMILCGDFNGRIGLNSGFVENVEKDEFLSLPNAGISLTGYPPGLTAGPPIFSVKIPTPGTAFQCKTLAPGSKKRNKIPSPRHNLSSLNAKISIKKDHNFIIAVLSRFSIIVR